jgi:hypothetical protein
VVITCRTDPDPEPRGDRRHRRLRVHPHAGFYLDENSPIAGGREIWGVPKKLATPKLSHEQETLVGTLSSVRTVSATMGYKHKELPLDPLREAMAKPAVHDQDHPARRLRAAGLRAGALPPRGRDAEGGLIRPGGAAAVRACDVRRRAIAGA